MKKIIFILSVLFCSQTIANPPDSLNCLSFILEMGFGNYYPQNPFTKSNLPYSFGSAFNNLSNDHAIDLSIGIDRNEKYGVEFGLRFVSDIADNNSLRDYAQNEFGSSYISSDVFNNGMNSWFVAGRYTVKYKKFRLISKIGLGYMNHYEPPTFHIITKQPMTNDYTIYDYKAATKKVLYVYPEINLCRRFFLEGESVGEIGIKASYNYFRSKYDYVIARDNFYNPIPDEQVSFKETVHGFVIAFYYCLFISTK